MTILSDSVIQQSALRNKHFKTYRGASSYARTTPWSQHRLTVPCNTPLPLEAPQPRAVQAGAGLDLGTEGCSSRNHHTSISQGLAINYQEVFPVFSSDLEQQNSFTLREPTAQPRLPMCCCSEGTPAPFLQLLLRLRPGDEQHVHTSGFILCRPNGAQLPARP